MFQKIRVRFPNEARGSLGLQLEAERGQFGNEVSPVHIDYQTRICTCVRGMEK